METNEAVTQSESTLPKLKEKKPRSEKQMEAFKRCAEKRKQKLIERNIIKQQTKSSPNADVIESNALKVIMEQINELKNQVKISNQKDIQQQPQPQPQIHPQLQLQTMHQDLMEEEIDQKINQPLRISTASTIPTQQHHHQRQHQNQYQYQYQHQHQNQHQHQHQHQRNQHQHYFQSNNDVLGLGVGSGYDVTGRQKRDIRGMDPYADERQSMIEKVYTRNVNIERQRELEKYNQKRFSDENSIQLLNPQYNQYNGNGEDRMQVENYDYNDSRGKIVDQAQNMSNMIRTGSNTTQSRKLGAIAVNGLRVASRR